ncbi:hypothetical protein T265_11892 [Opisthorchis viverrini]|uniref:Uncharacterized protein n=1 Tax=Opisthorchis viverrini TaxID=6198 RepID=A0A074YWV2_OPIVI|nr:hypothetical protein T265_11892 [Opisthorchis viverrini]KER19276.1 hypothetical protein T265_11892 [Opisthorchis viverrini]
MSCTLTKTTTTEEVLLRFVLKTWLAYFCRRMLLTRAKMNRIYLVAESYNLGSLPIQPLPDALQCGFLIRDDISIRLRKARAASVKLYRLWRRRDVSLSVNGRVYDSAIRSLADAEDVKNFQCLIIDVFGALAESGGTAGSVMLKYSIWDSEEITRRRESSQSASSSNVTPPVWTRASVEARMRRVDLDLLPKTSSPRGDTFDFYEDVSLSFFYLIHQRSNVHSGLAPFIHTSSRVSNSESSQSASSSNVTPPVWTRASVEARMRRVDLDLLPKVPVGRSEMFKTKLLTLRQKRLLGAFFEWCFNLAVDDNQTPIAGAPQNGSYDGCTDVVDKCSVCCLPPYGAVTEPLGPSLARLLCINSFSAYATRPFREFLREQHNLDQFLQEVITTNLALAGEHIMTDEAIRRIRRLLISMNRFGQHPILWPLYGCGDLPQSYCRMSAVFGAVFCLDCQLVSLRPIETQLGDAGNRRLAMDTIESGPTRSARQFVARLSNGHEVRTTCCVVGADCAPEQWIQTQVHRYPPILSLILVYMLFRIDFYDKHQKFFILSEN